MDLTLLTPLGALLGLGALLPLLALRLVARRAGDVRRAVGLPEPSRLSRQATVAALVTTGVLLALAATQPRLEWQTARPMRVDAEAFVVLDTSRSMLARESPRADIRYHRARRLAIRFRDGLEAVPVGIASLTDRVLPHLFPSADDDVFVATLRRSIGVDRPPPQGNFVTTATRLDALEAVVTRRFFSPQAHNRLLLVLTDGESVPVAGARLGNILRRPPAVSSVFVHVWDSDERVYAGGQIEPQYSPDPRSRTILETTAAAVGGAVFDEGEIDDAIETARELLGEGAVEPVGERRNRLALAPYLAGAVFLPLAFLLWRRDL